MLASNETRTKPIRGRASHGRLKLLREGADSNIEHMRSRQTQQETLMTDTTTDLASLREELSQLEERRAELQRKILVSRRTELRTFTAELINLIKERGHDMDEVIGEFNRRRSRSTSSRSRSVSEGDRTVLALNEDPSLTYVRGVTPDWMKQKMRDHGLDPGSRADRLSFRNDCMHVVEGGD
jgi:septal ring factor EnvC (AmiA/AmiB activator)